MKHTVLSTLFLVLSLGIVAQENINMASLSHPKLTITLYEKEIYYSDSPIDVLLTLSNVGSDMISFRLAETKAFNIMVEMKRLGTGGNNPNFQEVAMRSLPNGLPVLFRETNLAPGEQLGFVVGLEEFLDVWEPGLYSLQIHFYPHLNVNSMESVSSNILTLHIRPGTTNTMDEIQQQLETAREEMRRELGLAPDEVIEYIIQAKQDNSRNQFFLYLDLQNLIQVNSDLYRDYAVAGESERERILEEFRQVIWDGDSLDDSGLGRMMSPPVRYEILQTNYTPNQGTVNARLWFDMDRYYRIKNYTFNLMKDNDTWVLVEYTVNNSTTERKE